MDSSVGHPSRTPEHAQADYARLTGTNTILRTYNSGMNTQTSNTACAVGARTPKGLAYIMFSSDDVGSCKNGIDIDAEGLAEVWALGDPATR